MKIYVFCGIPGSGKTYLSKQLASECNTNLFCLDEIPGSHGPHAKKIKHTMYINIQKKLRNGEDVIVDAMYITKKQRDELLRTIRDIECEKILIVVQAPIEVCVERDRTRKTHNLGDGVVRHFNKRYQPPSVHEGWDDIKFIENI